MCEQYGPTDIRESALELIGNTPLVALDRIWSGSGRILAKCEFMSPGASVKDRVSLSMVTAALKSGQLKPGEPIVEMTSGNTGIGLSVVSAVLGHPLTLTMSAGNSPQRAVMMRALGSRVELSPQVDGTPGNVTGADLDAVEDRAVQLASETGAFFADQFNNLANIRAHEETTGPEIWRQTGGRIDAFVALVGTAGTFSGVSQYLKRQRSDIKCIAVEPIGAEPIKGEPVNKPAHVIQGGGYGKVPPLFTYDTMDGTVGVSDEEVIHYKRQLAHREGIYVGYSSGANVAAAVKLLKSGKLPQDAWVVTMLNDSGLKYPSME